jgi:hypothetical protein
VDVDGRGPRLGHQDGLQGPQDEVDDGCYEAYAIDDKGRRMEIYINPVTAAVVKMKQDD